MAQELAKKETGAALPAYLDDYKGHTGTEDMGADDVAIPRIKLGQALTAEVKDGVVKDGDLFLNVSQEVLAAKGEPLRIIPLVRTKEYILWNPQRGEGILARAFPVNVNGTTRFEWDQPGAVFDVKVEKKNVTWELKKYVDENNMDKWGSAIPGDPDSGIAATLHYNFIVALPDDGNFIAALSLSKTQVKRAKEFNALLKMSSAPIFSRVFTVEATSEKNSEGEFNNLKFKPAGFVESQEEFNQYRMMAESFADRQIVVDQSDGDSTENDTEEAF